MIAINVFRVIGDFFTNVLFIPFQHLRFNHTWWSSNIVSIFLILLGIMAFAFWMTQMAKYKKEGDL